MAIQLISNLNYPIGNIINLELQNSNKSQIAVAFLKYSGIEVINKSLKKSLENGGNFELIAGLDFKTTEPRAMKYFISLKKEFEGVNFYCFGDKENNKTDIVFHPKIYLFENRKETTAIVGSTNLTGGGLMSNFEVNTIFKEKNPLYYSQLQAIYNSIKFTDSLFSPDEEYLNGYSAVFNAFLKNEKNALKDKGVSAIIKEIQRREEILPGAVPSIKLMIAEFIKRKNSAGQATVNINEIYEELEKIVKGKDLTEKYKMDTFRNTIRGELNTHEQNSKHPRNLKLFLRSNERGFYSLTEKGKNYIGR